MRICHVSAGLCPRMVKLAWCQRDAGDRVSWIGERHTYQKTIPFDSMEVCEEGRFGGMTRALRKAQADVFHVHTHIRDGKILETVRRAVDAPIVWDAHDKPDAWDGTKADLGAYLEIAKVVYRPYCSQAWFAPEAPASFRGLVISTGLSDVPGHFRYWMDVFRDLDAVDIPVRCYTFSKPPTPLGNWDYGAFCDLLGPVDVRTLILKMSHSTAGLCGSEYLDDNMLQASPNKLWEYVAAGIPAVCFGRSHLMAITIEENGLGIVVDEIKEIAERWDELDEIRKHVVDVRGRFTMESEVPKVTEVYKRCL